MKKIKFCLGLLLLSVSIWYFDNHNMIGVFPFFGALALFIGCIDDE